MDRQQDTPMPVPQLHLMCGKIASGKSTLASALAVEHAAVLLSEDHWLASLYPGEIRGVADYVRLARRIREVVGPLVIKVLESGASVVMDFPGNTVANRQWLASLAQAARVGHCLHYLEVEDEVCRARLHARNERAEHDFAATDAEFDVITGYFQAPAADEGLEILIHRT